MSSGITYQDTENMDEYERVFVIKKLIAMKKEEIEARKDALKNMNKEREYLNTLFNVVMLIFLF